MDPINKEPQSPKNTFRVRLKLNHKNPSKALIIIIKNKNHSGLETRIIPPATRKNLMDINEAKPSKPSIKFNAFTTTTKTKTLDTNSSHQGNS